MVKLKDKKAQELWQLLVLVLGIVVVLVVGYFVYNSFQTAGGIVDTLPSALAVKLQLCESLTTNAVAFCEFTPIDLSEIKGDAYVNCKYPGKEFAAAINALGGVPSCSSTSEEEFCNALKMQDGFKKANINGKGTCTKDKGWVSLISKDTCTGMGGSWQTAACNLDTQTPLTPTDESDKGINVACCKSL